MSFFAEYYSRIGRQKNSFNPFGTAPTCLGGGKLLGISVVFRDPFFGQKNKTKRVNGTRKRQP